MGPQGPEGTGPGGGFGLVFGARGGLTGGELIMQKTDLAIAKLATARLEVLDIHRLPKPTFPNWN